VSSVIIAGRRTSPQARFVPQPWLVDASFVVVLIALGAVGFRPIYGGHEYLVVAVIGALLGVAGTQLALKLRQPVLAEAAVAVLVSLLFGGALTTDHGIAAGLIPTATTISALAHVGVYGWKELLTSSPPVGGSSDLLVIPYIVGLIGGVAGQSLARRTRSPSLPLLGPTLVLCLSILFGARYPTSVVLQGSVFAVLALVWAVLRYQRIRVVASGPGFGRNRWLVSAAVLAVVGLSAGMVGPDLPGGRGRSRVVLSQYVVPPFQASQQPSPLAGFRQYVEDGPLNKKVLFTVKGLPTGSEIRIATMDEYNGVAWGFAVGTDTDEIGSTDVFRRYSSTIQPSRPGRVQKVKVTIGQLGGVWLPEVGELTHVTFPFPDPSTLANDFRYDTDTETAALPSGIRPGETYMFEADVVSPTTDPRTLDSLGVGNAPIDVSEVPNVLQLDASGWAANVSSPFAKVMAIADHLRTDGYFSDGLEQPTLSLPGHSAGRLTRFLEGGPLVGTEIVGDGEQYAAAFALMADAVGVPARLVLGAKVGRGGVVTGASVQPWVEVDLAGAGWQPIYRNAFMDPTRKAHETPPTPKHANHAPLPVVPPVVSANHTPLGAEPPGSSGASLSHVAQRAGKTFHLPAWAITMGALVLGILAVVVGISALISGIKRRRRRRRRYGGGPASQIAGAWSELVDLSRDLRVVVPERRTRREEASYLDPAEAVALAVRGDAAVFGPGDPPDEEVRDYWSAMYAVTQQMQAGLGLLARWRVRVSIRSLRPTPSQAAS